jgi:glycosyltransferase involved in cell wall biosynthesis
VAREPQAPVKVSVVIPCYNSTAFLNDTARSVLAQTLLDIEIIFVDDGSSDGTARMVERIITANPGHRVRLATQSNAGVAAARNRGISEAYGRYILPLDADDCIAPTTLEECAALLDADAALHIVYTDRQDFGDIDRIWTAGKFELRRLKYFNQISYCSMFRKSMWEELVGYRTNVSGFDDWDFWIAACLRGFRARHLPKPLLRHRRHHDSFLWKILDQYETLFAQLILNNPEAYSAEEIEAANRFISLGAASSLLQASKFIFVSRYYEGYGIK